MAKESRAMPPVHVEAMTNIFLDEPERKLGSVQSSTIDGVSTTQALGIKDFWDPSSKMTDETLVGIGSTGKQFTAATLLKLWDQELTAKKAGKEPTTEWFPDGVDTLLAHFMLALEKKYPQCEEIFTRIKADPEYSKVTLRDLLQHTHGLGGRNKEKAIELVRSSGENPIELDAIIDLTEKDPSQDKYGVHRYTNFGFDCAGMIIELVASDMQGKAVAFDEAVKDLVLAPNGLTHTHMQSDNQVLYKDQTVDIARGYALDFEVIEGKSKQRSEIEWNTKTNTRAGGGCKSTVSDLTRWAPLYMGATMFENEEVQQAVTDRSRAAKLPNGTGTYHLAIMETEKEGTKFLGHPGDDLNFHSNLWYDPKTKAVQTSLSVVETLTPYVCNQIAAKAYPEDQPLLDSFKRHFFAIANDRGRPAFASKEAQEIMDEVKAARPKEAAAVDRYCQLCQHVAETYSPKELAEQRESIIQKEVSATARQRVDALDLATMAPLSPELKAEAKKIGADISTQPPLPAESKDPANQTWAEKMASYTSKGSREI